MLYPAVMEASSWFDARRLPPLPMLPIRQPFLHIGLPVLIVMVRRALINKGGLRSVVFALANLAAHVCLTTVLVPVRGDPPAG